MTTVAAKKKDRLRGLVEPFLQGRGYEIADIIVAPYKQRSTVRFFLYHEKGVSIDNCVELSRHLGDLIDSTDLFEHGYTLEVSSPGLDRPLTTGLDFRYRVGETVRVDCRNPERTITGKIARVDDATVELIADDETVVLAIEDIDRGRILF